MIIDNIINNITNNITKNIIPSDLPIIDSSLKIWLNNRFTYDGDNRVSKWFDDSGNDNHLEQLNITQQGLYSLDKGKGAVSFDGTDDYLSITDDSLLIDDQYSVFIVAEELSSDSNYNAILSTRVNAVGGFNFYRINTGQYQSWFYDPSAGTPPWRIANSNIIEPINTKFVMAEIATKGVTNGRSLELQGSNNAEITATLPSAAISNPVGLFELAVTNNSSSFFGNFKIYEVLFYNRALTSLEKQRNLDYLSTKYKI